MRRAVLLASMSIVLGAFIACASSEDSDEDVAAPPGAPVLPIVTDGSTGEAAPDDAGSVRSSCSDAGWCITPLPDTDLVVTDIWPVAGHAFAVADSPTRGFKVLAWDDADPGWKYIDDNRQNEYYVLGSYIGRIWAPNDSEVYYTVSPGTLYHGKRPAPPLTAWTWERHPFEDHSHGAETTRWEYPVVGVWGTGADDVYAWYANTIFHLTSEGGGAPTWVAEYIADDLDDPSENVFFASAGGRSRDDIWFTGARDRNTTYTCAVAVQKTSAGYRRVIDSSVKDSYSDTCAQRAEGLGPGPTGWLTDIQPAGTDAMVGFNKVLYGLNSDKGTTLARIAAKDGVYSTVLSPIATGFDLRPSPTFNSLWVNDEETWVSGFGSVLRGPNEPDAGVFRFSTLALNGAPLRTPILRVRGTSNTNLWAIGSRYALHKTTP
jgi:hypothetical protein